MADCNPPLIFGGPCHQSALDAARAQFESGAFVAVIELLTATINPLIARSTAQSKCGADLMALLAARGVFLALARRSVSAQDVNCWLAVTRQRALAAMDVCSVAALNAPAMSIQRETHVDWMAACRIARADGLFRADAKAAPRRKVKLGKARPRAVAEHQPAPFSVRQHWEAS